MLIKGWVTAKGEGYQPPAIAAPYTSSRALAQQLAQEVSQFERVIRAITSA
jgi:hypothetical protein